MKRGERDKKMGIGDKKFGKQGKKERWEKIKDQV